MAEVTIASHKWRLPTDDFSPLCDNTLKLNNSAGLIDNPSKLNSKAVCAPSCDLCITPFPRGLSKPGCYCSVVPTNYDVTFPSAFQGTNADWTSCFSVASARASFGAEANDGKKTCTWQAAAAAKKIVHRKTETFVFGVGWIFDCGSSATSEPAFTVTTAKKDNDPTLGRMTVSASVLWGNPDGSTITLKFVWAGDITGCFGEFPLTFDPMQSVMIWPQDPQFPNQGNYVLNSFFSYPPTITVKSAE